MRHLISFIAVALLAFGIGIGAYRAAVIVYAIARHEQMISVAQLREDEWHRLYEASMMAGDADLRREMVEKSLCMGTDYVLDARLVVQGVDGYCLKADGSMEVQSYVILPNNSFRALLDAHHSWVMEHMSFLAEVSTPEKARAYVIAHRP